MAVARCFGERAHVESSNWVLTSPTERLRVPVRHPRPAGPTMCVASRRLPIACPLLGREFVLVITTLVGAWPLTSSADFSPDEERMARGTFGDSSGTRGKVRKCKAHCSTPSPFERTWPSTSIELRQRRFRRPRSMERGAKDMTRIANRTPESRLQADEPTEPSGDQAIGVSSWESAPCSSMGLM